MNLYHSTHWENLMVIMGSELIEPQKLNADDSKNNRLKALADLHVQWTWFSTQSWSPNRFGAYILKFGFKDLVLPKIVPLGFHKGARCYLSVPPFLAKWAASKLSVGVISTANDTTWRPKNVDDRVDILVAWAVPVTTSLIDFAYSTRKDDTFFERDPNFASARFWAKMMLDSDHRFDTSAKNTLDLSANLLRWVTGLRDVVFQKAQSKALGAPPAPNPELLNRAFALLIDADINEAAVFSAYIGAYREVANEVATRVNAHFPGKKLTGAEIEKASD